MDKQTSRIKPIRREGRLFSNFMVAPAVLLLLVMSVFPLIFTIYYSFTDYYYLSKDGAEFIGLANFQKLLQNGYFRQAVWNTIKFTVISVVFELVIGLGMAVYVHGMKRGKSVMRTLLLLPYLLPPVTVALIWQILLSNNYGILNEFLRFLGLPVYNWFFDINTAFGTIVVIEIWQCTPFVFLMIYASLQGVPEDQYEAARIDGANRWQQFRYITLPNIQSGIFFSVLIRTIDTFRLFDKINVLTKGGPANSTATITQYLYNNGIKNLQFGFGSAGAIIMAVLVLLLSAPYIRRAVKR